jgi:hypothetical protein
MSFTIVFALVGLLALIGVFALTYKFKGLKSALIAAAVAIFIEAIAFGLLIFAIVSVMPN